MNRAQEDVRDARAGIRRAALVAPVAAALAVRLWNIGSQVFGDDEFHAVRTALVLPLSRILETYHASDNSIPITAAYRIWMDAGGHLTDFGMRAPVVLASLMLVFFGPRLAAPLCGATTARLWAWALALSPLLVVYGRLARSYAAVLLLGTCAALALLRYLRGEPTRYAALFVVCGAGAIWFHPGAGPFVVASLAAAALAAVVSVEAKRSIAVVVGLGTALALVGGALIFPALDSLQELVAEKAGWDTLNLRSLLEAATLFSGVRFGAFAAALWAVAALGCVSLWRSHSRGLAIAIPITLLGQGVGLVLLSPDMSSALYTLRAFLVCLPLLLLAAVAGLEALARAAGLGAAQRRVAFGAALLCWIALGPFVEPSFWSTPFRQHDDYIVFTRNRPQLEDAAVPSFYVTLGAAPEGALVEMPWHPFWGFGHAVPAYQEHHGREVIVANSSELARRPEIRWRRYVRAAPEALLATTARFAIVHLDLESEERAARLARGFPDLIRPRPEHWNPLRAEASILRKRLDSEWGPPDFDDGVTAVWDLGRIRGA